MKKAGKRNRPDSTITQRSLTISTQFHPREDYRYIVVPSIRLEGIWLSRLGFKQGEKVKLLCRKNKVLIVREGNG